MSKRAGQFERNERDYYPTPYEAVLPLLGHLPKASTFVEPCAGDGRLIRHLEKHGHQCTYASDLEPVNDEHAHTINIEQQDVLFFGHQLPQADFIITNPPWGRDVLHPMIEAFITQAPTWLLFDTDWWSTKQSIPFKPFCHATVTVGRISWMGNGVAGMDNCSWYLFGKDEADTIAY